MESIFDKGPTARVATVYDRIGPEILHLQKGSSVRDGEFTGTKTGAWAAFIAILLLIGLFIMDPFLFAMHKSSAAKAYIYLHHYGSESATKDLAASQLFSPNEIEALNNRKDTFQSYFASPAEAGETATSAVDFMNGIHALRAGQYENLDPIGKLRYMLFVRNGLYPPTIWDGLDPSVY